MEISSEFSLQNSNQSNYWQHVTPTTHCKKFGKLLKVYLLITWLLWDECQVGKADVPSVENAVFPVTVNLSRWACNGYSTDDSYDPGLGYITGYYQGNYHGR